MPNSRLMTCITISIGSKLRHDQNFKSPITVMPIHGTVRYRTVLSSSFPKRDIMSLITGTVRYRTYSSYIGYLLTYVMVRIFTSSHLWNIVLFFSCSLTCMTSNPLSLEIPTKILQYHCISNHAIIMLMRIILL